MAKKGLNIYKRKDGRWEARYIKARTAQGKPLYGYLYAPSYHEARNRLQTVQDSALSPAGTNRSGPFEAFSMEWLDTFSTGFKESTYIRYRTLIKCYLVPYFQTATIEEISRETVLGLCRELGSHGKKDGTPLSPKTISDILSVLRRILNYARSQDMTVDPAIFDIRIRQPQKAFPVLSLHEQLTLQQYLAEHPDTLNLGILLCLLTGIRIGELCALTWDRISLPERSICICQTMQRIQTRTPEAQRTHLIVSPPKSSSANRTIPISHMLLEFLELYPRSRTGYFLQGTSSKPIEPRCVQRRFHRVLAVCGLEKRNFHVLRHTFATRCVEARIDIKTLSEILGHSSVTITMNRYVHPSLELKRETMEQLAEFISVK